MPAAPSSPPGANPPTPYAKTATHRPRATPVSPSSVITPANLRQDKRQTKQFALYFSFAAAIFRKYHYLCARKKQPQTPVSTTPHEIQIHRTPPPLPRRLLHHHPRPRHRQMRAPPPRPSAPRQLRHRARRRQHRRAPPPRQHRAASPRRRQPAAAPAPPPHPAAPRRHTRKKPRRERAPL